MPRPWQYRIIYTEKENLNILTHIYSLLQNIHSSQIKYVCVLEQSLKFQKFVHYYGGGGGGHQTFDHAVKVFLKSMFQNCTFHWNKKMIFIQYPKLQFEIFNPSIVWKYHFFDHFLFRKTHNRVTKEKLQKKFCIEKVNSNNCLKKAPKQC